jgi:hypothetical protein
VTSDSSDIIIRPATTADVNALGRLGALLVGEALRVRSAAVHRASAANRG